MSEATSHPNQFQPFTVFFQFADTPEFIPQGESAPNNPTNENRAQMGPGVFFFGTIPSNFFQGGTPPSFSMAPNDMSVEEFFTRIAEARSVQDAFKPRPASEKSVASLDEYIVKEDSELLSENCENCTICLDSFQKDQTVNHMPCRHVFHKDCLLPWLNQSHTCPSCRYPLLTEDKDYNEKVLQDRSKRSGCTMRSIHLCEHPEDMSHSNLINLTCGHSYHASCFNTALASTNQSSESQIIRCFYCRHSSQISS